MTHRLLVASTIEPQRIAAARGKALHAVRDEATVGTDVSHGGGWAARPANGADGVANCDSEVRNAGVVHGEVFASHPEHLPGTNRRAAAWPIQDLPQ